MSRLLRESRRSLARLAAHTPELRRPYPFDEDCCTGMDVPTGPWTAEDVAYWTGTARYQPWKDVAAFFRSVHVGGHSDSNDRAE